MTAELPKSTKALQGKGKPNVFDSRIADMVRVASTPTEHESPAPLATERSRVDSIASAVVQEGSDFQKNFEKSLKKESAKAQGKKRLHKENAKTLYSTSVSLPVSVMGDVHGMNAQLYYEGISLGLRDLVLIGMNQLKSMSVEQMAETIKAVRAENNE